MPIVTIASLCSMSTRLLPRWLKRNALDFDSAHVCVSRSSHTQRYGFIFLSSGIISYKQAKSSMATFFSLTFVGFLFECCSSSYVFASHFIHFLFCFFFFRYFVFFPLYTLPPFLLLLCCVHKKEKKNFDSQTGNIWCTQFILPDHVHNFIIDFVQLAHVRSKFFLFHSLFASLLFIVKINDEEYVFRLRKERSNWRKYVKYV